MEHQCCSDTEGSLVVKDLPSGIQAAYRDLQQAAKMQTYVLTLQASGTKIIICSVLSRRTLGLVQLPAKSGPAALAQHIQFHPHSKMIWLVHDRLKRVCNGPSDVQSSDEVNGDLQASPAPVQSRASSEAMLLLQQAQTEERKQLQVQHQSQLQQLQQQERQLRGEQEAARKRVEAERQLRVERAKAQEDATLQQEREDARLRQEVGQGEVGRRKPPEACMTSTPGVTQKNPTQTDACTDIKQRHQRHLSSYRITDTQTGFHTTAACHVSNPQQSIL